MRTRGGSQKECFSRIMDLENNGAGRQWIHNRSEGELPAHRSIGSGSSQKIIIQPIGPSSGLNLNLTSRFLWCDKTLGLINSFSAEKKRSLLG